MPRWGEQVVQYDLFGEVEAAERAAISAARTASASAGSFLVETPWPGLVGWWLHPEAIESRPDGAVSYRAGPNDTAGWAWAVGREGLGFESGDTWQGVGARPRWCIAWAELRALRDGNPDVTARLRVLAAGRGHPCSRGWRWWAAPHCLRPDGMHPGHLDREQQPVYYVDCERPDTAYVDRLEAWRLALGAVEAGHLAVSDRFFCATGRFVAYQGGDDEL